MSRMQSSPAFSAVTRSGHVRRPVTDVSANSLVNIDARYHPYVRVVDWNQSTDRAQAAPLPYGPPAEGSRLHAIVIPDEPVVIVIPDEPVVIVIPDEPNVIDLEPDAIVIDLEPDVIVPNEPAPEVPWVQAYPLPQGMDMSILVIRDGTAMEAVVRNVDSITVANALANVVRSFVNGA